MVTFHSYVSLPECTVSRECWSGLWFQPLWKIWKSVWVTIPKIWKVIKVMFQSTNRWCWSFSEKTVPSLVRAQLFSVILWMEEILHQLVNGFPIIIPLFPVFHMYLIVPNWCRISSIHSIIWVCMKKWSPGPPRSHLWSSLSLLLKGTWDPNIPCSETPISDFWVDYSTRFPSKYHQIPIGSPLYPITSRCIPTVSSLFLAYTSHCPLVHPWYSKSNKKKIQTRSICH